MPKYELIQIHIFQQSVQQNYFDRINVLNSGIIFIYFSIFFNNIVVVNVRFS